MLPPFFYTLIPELEKPVKTGEFELKIKKHRRKHNHV